MVTLTTSDRESLIKMASSLPKGDETRKAILAGLVIAGTLESKLEDFISKMSPGSEVEIDKLASKIPGLSPKEQRLVPTILQNMNRSGKYGFMIDMGVLRRYTKIAETRRVILARLKTSSIPEIRPASADALLDATSHIPGRNVKELGELGVNIVYAVEGETNTKVGAALVKLLTSHGFTNVVKGKFMGSSEIGFSANYREGGRIFATLLSRTRGGRVTTYVSVEARNSVGRSAASNEPMARALERMKDALDRGGIDTMIKATAARLKATKDPSKALGIAMAIKQFLAQYSSTLSSSQEKELLWIQSSAEGTGTLGGGIVATRTEVPGPGAPVVKDAYNYQNAILPAGFVDVATGANQHWPLNDTTAEVWKDGDNKLFAVVTHGHKPLCGIGSFCSFKHDQTGRPLRLGARMVGWFNLDPAGKFGGDIPKSGKLPVSTYK